MGELAGLCSLHWVKMGKFGRPASISHGDNQWFQKNNAFGYLVPIITVSFFLHGSFGLNSKWGYINPTYCTMVVVGVSTSIPLGPIWHNPVWVKILYPKTWMVYIYQKTQQKSKKTYLPLAIVRCLSCGSLPAVGFWVESQSFFEPRYQNTMDHGEIVSLGWQPGWVWFGMVFSGVRFATARKQIQLLLQFWSLRCQIQEQSLFLNALLGADPGGTGHQLKILPTWRYSLECEVAKYSTTAWGQRY